MERNITLQYCHGDAKCENTIGSYECVCKKGYTGDGFYCEGKKNMAEAYSDNNCGGEQKE